MIFYSPPSKAQVQADVTILFRSFISGSHPTAPGVILTTTAGMHVILAPDLGPIYLSLRGTCFSTDDRDFDATPTASARTTVEFVLHIRGRELTVDKPPGRDVARTGVTKNVDCNTGAELQPPRQASASGITVGEVKKSDFMRVLFVKASASDPFYNLVPAPAVDFSFVLTYYILLQKIVMKGSMDEFPSFEGYSSVDGKAPTPIVQFKPAAGATAMSLLDLNLGLHTRNFEATISLK